MPAIGRALICFQPTTPKTTNKGKMSQGNLAWEGKLGGSEREKKKRERTSLKAGEREEEKERSQGQDRIGQDKK